MAHRASTTFRRRAGIALASVLLLAWPAFAGKRDAAPPNVVLITLDTTRADRLGCYGAKQAATPNLDALAAGGVRFDRAQSPSPLTVPAHASMMTGLAPRQHGARDNALYPLPGEVPVLAGLLAENGFDTAAFVSSVVLDRRAGLSRGFRHYDDRVRIGRRSAFNYEERAASQTNASVFAGLERLEPPFFLWVHYFDPHLPYVPPPPFDERFSSSPYDGEIAFMDDAVGELLRRVDARFPGSLIVVAGDHGEGLGEHGEAAHGVFLYQSTQHVPLIVSGPGVSGGRVVTQRVGLVDLMPTVLSLTRGDVPAGIDGRSLVPLLGGKGRWKDADYEMETLFPSLAYDWAPLRGLVRGDHVLIDAPFVEFYDLAADPGQTRNLGGRHGDAKPLRRALQRLTESDTPPAAALDESIAERRMRLAALGYTGGTPRSSPGSIDPKDGIDLLVLLDEARAALQHRRPTEAIELLDGLLEKNPGNVHARLALVTAWLDTEQAEKAVAMARDALERSPGDDLVHFHLANALFAESKARPAARVEAREQYEQTLRLNPRRADAYLNYASLLVAAGEPGPARELLVRAEAAGVEDPDLATERALLELLAGRPEAAIRYFEEALRLNPHADDAAEALRRLRSRSVPDPG